MDIATLKDRLRGIVKPASELPPHPAPVESSASLASATTTSTQTDICETLGGSWRDTGVGRSFVVTRRVAAEERHGCYRVGDFAETLNDASSAASLVGRASAQTPFVFFDLETTGLNGGAGTHAFLVGCGWFDADDGFVTEQHLMTDFASERQMLGSVAAELQRAGTLMSFNGKSFDAPMLETRYLFHRLTSPCADRPHVDLLHPARRFWGSNPETGCSLGVLEHQLFRLIRSGDVSGYEIPARYFRFVRSSDAGLLVDVLHHNRLDLLSLAGLTARILSLVQAGPEAAARAREALALGRVYREAGLDERAEFAFERALELLDREEGDFAGNQTRSERQERTAARVETLRSLALGARRQRRYEHAASRWQQLLAVGDCPPHIAREAIEALAIHHEHRVRDLASAKLFALKGVELRTTPARGDAAGRRLARIERKLLTERPLFPSSTWPPSSGSQKSGRQISS